MIIIDSKDAGCAALGAALGALVVQLAACGLPNSGCVEVVGDGASRDSRTAAIGGQMLVDSVQPKMAALEK